MTSILIAAAVSGIVSGAQAASSPNSFETPAPDFGVQALDEKGKKDKHACKGQNACKGRGGCKTDKHACKGQNACKGQGGCKG
ncbi:MAG TPA: hypothetical protein VIM73_11720 [Polyangiaceae bacterium]